MFFIFMPKQKREKKEENCKSEMVTLILLIITVPKNLTLKPHAYLHEGNLLYSACIIKE